MVDFNNKSILITGGAGFIGSNLANFIENKYPNANIVIFDSFRNNEIFENGNLKSFGHFKNLLKFTGKIITGNIDSKNDLTVLNNYKFDYIFHFAAISDTRVYDQETVFRTNINSFYFFLDKAVRDDSKLIYASSAATYGSLPSPQKIDCVSPENPYAYSKFSMDQLAKTYSQEFPSLNIVGLRYFNVYGPGEFYKGKTSSMIIQLGMQLLSNKKPRLFYGSDKIFRDFIYIKDVTKANLLACSADENGVYNIGSGVPRSFQDIVNILQNEFKTNIEVEYFDNPYKDYQNHTEADISLSEKNLQFFPSYSLEKGIADYIPYIKDKFNESQN